MKQFPESTRKRFEDVFLKGEEGMINDIKKAIYQYGLTANDLRGKKEYIELMLKLHKAVYGDKSQVITNNEPLQININQLQNVTKEVPDGTVKKAVEVFETEKSRKLRESLEPPEEDPESLFSSPLLPELLGEK
jgi:succinate dehydrogenase/fumarate reductase flavoprotein subunit